MADAHKNFAYSTVATAPSPAISGTSLIVQGGAGASFPTPPFNATVWPAASQPTVSNAEIVRVTAISTDTFTIVRSQESSAARTVLVGDQISASITVKTLTDIETLLPAGTVVGTTDAQTLSAKVLSDEFMGDVFESQSATSRDVVLLASKDFINFDVLEVGATATLEVPATSTIEVVPLVKQTEIQAFAGFYDYVESGCIWTADAVASTLLATMSEGFIWIKGRRLKVAAVKSRAFTASSDTYVDAYDNRDGTATLIYTAVTNNLSTGSPALPDGWMRLGIIVSGATNIAATTSINQGQEDRVLPIVSSIPYCWTDSLGNLICPRDPQRKIIGYRQIVATFATAALADVTGLNLNCLVPTGRKVKVSGFIGRISSSVANSGGSMNVVDVTNANTVLATDAGATNASGDVCSAKPFRIYTPASTAMQFKAQFDKGSNAATVNTNSSATNPSYLMVELE